LLVSNNSFDKNNIEISAHDSIIASEKNNKLLDSNDGVIFLISERGIIKPTNSYITIC